jgi:hypothetical protein
LLYINGSHIFCRVVSVIVNHQCQFQGVRQGMK